MVIVVQGHLLDSAGWLYVDNQSLESSGCLVGPAAPQQLMNGLVHHPTANH